MFSTIIVGIIVEIVAAIHVATIIVFAIVVVQIVTICFMIDVVEFG